MASLLVQGASAMGWDVATSAWVNPVALVLALAVITLLHMTVGEQAPKMWAIHRAEGTTLTVAYPLKVFTAVFQAPDLGHQRAFQSLANLEVRHIMVPRTDVAYLSADNSREQNLRIIRESGHSRFPLGAPDLDHVKGLILARIQTHCAIVMDEHGTAVGMAGEVPLPEAATVLGLDFQEEVDTVGGWLVATLGRFPTEGDSVEIANYRATVEDLEGHRIGLVRFEEKKDDREDPPTA